MESKKCPNLKINESNLAKNPLFGFKFVGWGTYLTPCVRALTAKLAREKADVFKYFFIG